MSGIIGETRGRICNTTNELISRSSYSQSLDELLGSSKPPIPVQRKIVDLKTTNNLTPIVSPSKINNLIPERPSTRHGSRSSASNNTALHSSNDHNSISIINSQEELLKPSSINLNVWSREEHEIDDLEEHIEEEEALSSGSSSKKEESASESDIEKNETNKIDNSFEKRLQELTKLTQSFKVQRTENNNLSPKSLSKKSSILFDKAEAKIKDEKEQTFNLPTQKFENIALNKNLQLENTSLKLENSPKQSVDTSWSKFQRSSISPITKKTTPTSAKTGSTLNGSTKSIGTKYNPKRPFSTTVASISGSKQTATNEENSQSYKAWLCQKLDIESEKLQVLKEKEENEKKKKEEKKKDAEKCFKRWKMERDSQLINFRKQKRLESEEHLKREKDAKEQKLRDAQKTFEYWKKEQNERLKQSRAKSTSLEQQRAKSIQDTKKEKKMEAEAAFSVWLENISKRKNSEIEKTKALKMAQKEQKEQSRYYKEKLAKEAYQIWLQMKNEEKKYSKSLASKIIEFENEAKRRWPITPWLPIGNTVPRRFIGSGNRRKTIEKPIILRYRRTQSTH